MRAEILSRIGIKPVALLLAMALTGAAIAAPPAPPAPDDAQNNANHGGNRRDPQEMRKMLEDRAKEMLGASDEEWSALQPRIEAVMKIQAQLRGNGMAMLFRRNAQPAAAAGAPADGNNNAGGGRRTGGGGFFGEQAGPVADAVKQLQTSLDNEKATPDEIKAKMAAVRDSRGKLKTDLTKAQDELKALVTSRQEAILLELGVLE